MATRKLLTLIFHWTAPLLAVILFYAGPTFADPDVHVTLLPREGTLDDVFLLKVTVSGRKRSELSVPQFAETRKFRIEGMGTVSNHQTINGVERYQISFNFRVRPDRSLRPGTYRLPSGSLEINGSAVTLKGEEIKILPRAKKTKKSKSRKASGTSIIQLVNNTKPYVGEQITYRVEIASTPEFIGGTLEDIELSGFWRESFGKKDRQIRSRGNITVRSFREVLVPTTSGALTIPERDLTAKIRVPIKTSRRRRRGFFRDPMFNDSFFGGWPFFGESTTETKRFVADPITVNVQPLPPAPITYKGHILVGSVQMRSTVSTDRIVQGDSITMKITLSGTANLRPYELPPASAKSQKDFKRYDDKPEIKTGVQGDKIKYFKTFTIALVPQRAGALQLPVFSVLTFNPVSKEYKILKTQSGTITVIGNREDQQLLLTAPDSASKLGHEQVSDNKKEITIVGEDLLPQHVGARTFHSRKTLSPISVAVFLILIPVLSLLLRIHLVNRHRLLSDPALLLERNAFRKAMDQITSEQPTAPAAEGEITAIQSLRNIVTTYLSERFRTRAESLTSKELAQLVGKRTGDQRLAETTRELLERLQALLYSGYARDAQQSENERLLQTAKGIIEAIEKRYSE